MTSQEQFSHLRDLYQAEVDSTTASVQAQLEFISQRMHKAGNLTLRHFFTRCCRSLVLAAGIRWSFEGIPRVQEGTYLMASGVF